MHWALMAVVFHTPEPEKQRFAKRNRISAEYAGVFVSIIIWGQLIPSH